MKIKNYGMEYDVNIEVSRYQNNGNLAICLVCDDGELYGTLTVNLGKLPDGMAYVDTNNMPDAERFIKEYGLGEFTGITAQSGYCTYPLYKFKEEFTHEKTF